MTTGPNPFADDLEPEGATRLQSADPLNPYAAPVGIEVSTEKDGAGVGVWRDGKYLVMHRDAKFPPRCIHTNEPAVIFRVQNLKWSYQVDYSRRTLPLEFGLSEQGLSRVERTRRNWLLLGSGSALLAVVALLCVVIGLSLNVTWVAEGMAQGILIGVIVAIIAFVQTGKGGSPFIFRSAKDSYLWLIGTPPAFLNSLPNWPGASVTKSAHKPR